MRIMIWKKCAKRFKLFLIFSSPCHARNMILFLILMMVMVMRHNDLILQRDVHWMGHKIGTSLVVKFLMKLAMLQLVSRCHCIPSSPSLLFQKLRPWHLLWWLVSMVWSPKVFNHTLETLRSMVNGDNNGDVDDWWCFWLSPGRSHVERRRV